VNTRRALLCVTALALGACREDSRPPAPRPQPVEPAETVPCAELQARILRWNAEAGGVYRPRRVLVQVVVINTDGPPEGGRVGVLFRCDRARMDLAGRADVPAADYRPDEALVIEGAYRTWAEPMRAVIVGDVRARVP
jgi:hypothetical protein